MAPRREDEEPNEEGLADYGFETRSEKLAYLAGLAEGVQRDEEPATANLLAGIVEVLQEVSAEIGALRREQRVLSEDMDELADELGVEPSDVVVECPSCGREVAFASGLLNEEDLELTCPNCGEVVYTPGEDELMDEPDAVGHPEPGVVARPEGDLAGFGGQQQAWHGGEEPHSQARAAEGGRDGRSGEDPVGDSERAGGVSAHTDGDGRQRSPLG